MLVMLFDTVIDEEKVSCGVAGGTEVTQRLLMTKSFRQFEAPEEAC